MRAVSLARTIATRRYPFPRALVGAGMGLSLGSAMIVKHQPTVRLEPPTVPRLGESVVSREEALDPELMRQLSGGSISGSSSSIPYQVVQAINRGSQVFSVVYSSAPFPEH